MAGNRICGGHGTPVHALGKCLCYTGYDGYACTSCAVGYQFLNGLCQRPYESFVAGDSFSGDRAGSLTTQSTVR
jgi:EGF-like domain